MAIFFAYVLYSFGGGHASFPTLQFATIYFNDSFYERSRMPVPALLYIRG